MNNMTDEYQIFLENLSNAGSTQESFRSAIRMTFQVSWVESTHIVRKFLVQRLPNKKHSYD